MSSRYSGFNLQGEGDIRNCSCHRAVKLLEHGMKVVERVLEKSHCRIVAVAIWLSTFLTESKK